MTVAHRVRSVTTDPTLVSTSPRDATAGQQFAMSVPADAGETVFIGDSGVDATIGFPVSPGEAISMPLHRSEKVYAIVASGPVDVNVLEVGI